MDSALIGVAGALLGLAVGSGFTFWSTRRSEVAAGAVAAGALAEQLRIWAVDGPVLPTGADAVVQTWLDHRASLVLHLEPDDYRKLGSRLRSAAQDKSEAEKFVPRLEALSDVLWHEHNDFIAKPVVRWVTRNTTTKRAHKALCCEPPSAT